MAVVVLVLFVDLLFLEYDCDCDCDDGGGGSDAIVATATGALLMMYELSLVIGTAVGTKLFGLCETEVAEEVVVDGSRNARSSSSLSTLAENGEAAGAILGLAVGFFDISMLGIKGVRCVRDLLL